MEWALSFPFPIGKKVCVLADRHNTELAWASAPRHALVHFGVCVGCVVSRPKASMADCYCAMDRDVQRSLCAVYGSRLMGHAKTLTAFAQVGYELCSSDARVTSCHVCCGVSCLIALKPPLANCLSQCHKQHNVLLLHEIHTEMPALVACRLIGRQLTDASQAAALLTQVSACSGRMEAGRRAQIV